MNKKDDIMERPSRFLIKGTMPKFWPPRPNRLWKILLNPIRQYYVRHSWRVSEVVIENSDVFKQFGPKDGVLIAPNHSHEGDAHIMLEGAKQVRKQFYFMAAWHAFLGHGGIDGWLLQRMGVFSVDREGCDRRALKQAVDLLKSGKNLVVFPEGEIHRLNDRLKPLLDGVSFMALNAQRELDKEESDAHVWILPAAIRYQISGNVTEELEAAMGRLEKRLLWWKPPKGASLQQRVICFGEAVLTIKEKEKLGISLESKGDLPTRINHLSELLLSRHEEKYLNKSPSAENVPLRVKALRRKLLDIWIDESKSKEELQEAREALDDVQLSLQLFSYPGNYISEDPSVERMAETVEKYEEDILGTSHSIGTRKATLVFGEPMDLKKEDLSKIRSSIIEVTDRLENAIRLLMKR